MTKVLVAFMSRRVCHVPCLLSLVLVTVAGRDGATAWGTCGRRYDGGFDRALFNRSLSSALLPLFFFFSRGQIGGLVRDFYPGPLAECVPVYACEFVCVLNIYLTDILLIGLLQEKRLQGA